MKLYREDVSDTEHQYKRDFQNLENSNFFEKYKEEKVYFTEVKDRVIRKIATMKWTILAYFFLLTITNSIVIGKLLNDISYNPLLAIVFAIVQITLFFVFYSEFPKSKSNEAKS